MSTLYPLRFETIFKEKIWGGQKIKTLLNKDFSPLNNCGETWELSAVPGDVSRVANGDLAGQALNELVAKYGAELLGDRVYQTYGKEFPLLIKFLDANDDLSVQVHPGDDLAETRHGSKGKTEMWYIIQADEGATLITGFNQPMDKEKYKIHVDKNQVMKILNKEPVKAGDVFFIPAGRIHTIGKGILLAEIQQTSDVTYRIYDFDRQDAMGNYRELHNEQAVDAIDYDQYDTYRTEYKEKRNESTTMVASKYFETHKLVLDQPTPRDYSGLDSFVIYISISGEGVLRYGHNHEEPIRQGEVYLVPACLDEIVIEPAGELNLLEVWV